MSFDNKFVHLRVHTAYSLLEGAITPDSLVNLCNDFSMPAVAITDTGNMFGALELSEKLSNSCVQPIIGCQLNLKYNEDFSENKFAPIVLLAKDETGYKNLLKLSSANYLECGSESPHITRQLLLDHQLGLICLTGGNSGPIGKMLADTRLEKVESFVDWLLRIFGDRLYIELQRHSNSEHIFTKNGLDIEELFLKLAYKKNIPIVATNDVYFSEQNMFEAHDALLCISEGSYVDQESPRRRLTPEHFFKSQQEMCTLFSDLPEAIENTIEIAKRCAFKSELRDPILPRFADNEVDELARQSREGLQKRLETISLSAPRKDYEERLNFELQVIEKMGFPGYFLIVADFIIWAKKNRIPVGPGRGSGAGSLVAYALTITDLDPIKYSLLFERFLNPERVSMPDFDIDFCMDRREEVIAYVQDRYGRDRVAQIITFGALLSKAAIRDIGRVLQIPYNQVDFLSKLIPSDGLKPVPLSKALKDEPRLMEAAAKSEVIDRMLNYAQKVEGLLRNAATHAAGVVIADRPLTELVPLYKDIRSDMPATQFNMKWVEQAGLVKFDFLGLKTLTVIQNAIDLLQIAGTNIDISNIPLDDEITYKLYTEARTIAVFQVESAGMRDALIQLKPNCIEDIIALVALYRPGPMENIPTFCEVKNGKKERNVIHPSIDKILDETQGIIVYQEQVMEIARRMAGYSLAGADLLRRAMGKKIKAAMDAEKPKFLRGSETNKVPKKTANEVWDLLQKFANYGFNKSHAAAYAILSYQTAWLKANYPVEFMAAVMNCDIHLTDKLSLYTQEIKSLNIPMIAPSINRSHLKFSVSGGSIIYALSAIKNVGSNGMELIVNARNSSGNFKDIFDFARRVDLKKIGKRPLEMLARAGSFDEIHRNRRFCLQSIDKLIAYSEVIFNERNSDQTNLFGEFEELSLKPRLSSIEDWSARDKLDEESQAVGFYLSGHPLDDFLSLFRDQEISLYSSVKKIAEVNSKLVTVAGIVSNRQDKHSARGKRFSFIQLSDPTGVYEVTVFSDILLKYSEHLVKGKILVLVCSVLMEGEQLKFLLKAVQPIEKLVEKCKKNILKIYINSASVAPILAQRLEEGDDYHVLDDCKIQIVVSSTKLEKEVEIALPKVYPVSREMLSAIKHISGVIEVEKLKEDFVN